MLNKKFEYKKRDDESVKRRAVQGMSFMEGYIKGEFKTLVLKDGIHNLRFLPPTWKDATHYGYEVWLHREIGADKNIYLCLEKMKGENCPICEERVEAEKDGDIEYVKKLRPQRRVLIWVIDRKEENEGPKILSCPPTLDINFCKLSVDNKTNEVLWIDDPDEGYDVEFERIPPKGKDGFPSYTGEKIDRHPCPLSSREDKAGEWLEYIVKNPLPSVLIYYPYEHIKKIFSRTSKKSDESSVVEEKQQEVISVKTEIKEEAKKQSIILNLKTNHDVAKLSRTQLEEVAIELGFEKDEVGKAKDDELRQVVCTELNVEVVKEPEVEVKKTKLVN